MHLKDIEGIVSIVAVTTNILQFLSGILVCKQYIINKTTAETSPLPFLSGIISTGLWLLYGIVKHDDNIVIVNVVGFVLMIGYTIVFYIYTFKKSSLLKQIVFLIMLIIIIMVYVVLEDDNELLVNRLGLWSCSLTLVAVAAPMSKVFYVVKVKSTECLPFPMILTSFIVSAVWFLYGIIRQDSYLLLPNLIGAALATAQLSLFVIYSNQPQSPSLIKTIIA